MKFIISSDDLDAMSSFLSRFSMNKPIDGFGYVTITTRDGVARFRTSNMEQTASIAFSVDNCVNGQISTEAGLFLRAVKAYSGLVAFELKGNVLIVKQGKSTHRLPVANDPILTELRPLEAEAISIDFKDFAYRLLFAIDASSNNNALGFFWMNKDALATSNGYMLGEGLLGKDTGIVTCVPVSALREVRDTVSVKFNGTQMDLFAGNYYISTRVADHKFPPYRNIIPKHESYIDVNKKRLVEMIQRSSIYANDSILYAKIGVQAGELFIETENDMFGGKDSIEGATNKDFEVSYGISLKYLTSVISSLGGSGFRIYFGTATNQPIVIQNTERPEITTLIMPISR